MPIQAVSQAVTPLRQRMLEDMAMRGLREETQRDYIRFVRSFAAFLRRSPDKATAEDIRRFQVHQAESDVQIDTVTAERRRLADLYQAGFIEREELLRRGKELELRRRTLEAQRCERCSTNASNWLNRTGCETESRRSQTRSGPPSINWTSTSGKSSSASSLTKSVSLDGGSNPVPNTLGQPP